MSILPSTGPHTGICACSMRGQLGAVLQHCGDVARRKFAAVVSGNCRKIGRLLLQRGSNRTIAASVCAMAWGAIAPNICLPFTGPVFWTVMITTLALF